MKPTQIGVNIFKKNTTIYLSNIIVKDNTENITRIKEITVKSFLVNGTIYFSNAYTHNIIELEPNTYPIDTNNKKLAGLCTEISQNIRAIPYNTQKKLCA